MKAKVVYIKQEKAKKINEILSAEKEFIENEKKEITGSNEKIKQAINNSRKII